MAIKAPTEGGGGGRGGTADTSGFKVPLSDWLSRFDGRDLDEDAGVDGPDRVETESIEGGRSAVSSFETTGRRFSLAAPAAFSSGGPSIDEILDPLGVVVAPGVLGEALERGVEDKLPDSVFLRLELPAPQALSFRGFWTSIDLEQV